MDDDHHNIRRRRSSQIPRGTVHLQVLKFDLMIFLVNYSIEKPRPDGLALAFQERKPGQSCDEAVNMAWPGLAYLGLAWPGLQPQAGPCTALPSKDGPGHESPTRLHPCDALLWISYRGRLNPNVVSLAFDQYCLSNGRWCSSNHSQNLQIVVNTFARGIER